MSEAIELLTIGYGRWPVKTRWEKFVAALQKAHVEWLIDIRHSPCASNLDPEHHYGPRDWHVQAAGGIVAGLEAAGIGYLWLVELGNPQKTDPEMKILRQHLADESHNWPLRRGLAILRTLVLDEQKRCCLLCACEDYDSCHRKVVAEAFRDLVAPVEVQLRDLSRSRR